MDWFLYGLAGLHAAEVLVVISLIGKPREPTTPGAAATSTLIRGIIIGLALYLAMTN